MATNNNSNLEDITFLVLDDNPGELILFKEIFSENGISNFELFEKSAKLEDYLAGEYNPEKKYALISDTDMPREQGPEIGSYIRDKYPKIKIVAMSGRDTAYKDWSKVNPDVFFRKPCDFAELDRIMKETISFLEFQSRYSVKDN